MVYYVAFPERNQNVINQRRRSDVKSWRLRRYHGNQSIHVATGQLWADAVWTHRSDLCHLQMQCEKSGQKIRFENKSDLGWIWLQCKAGLSATDGGVESHLYTAESRQAALIWSLSKFCDTMTSLSGGNLLVQNG